MNRNHVTASVASCLVAGALAVGCGGGGGGRGGGTTAPPISTGSIQSALPLEARDANGYAFSSFALNSVKGAGVVTALGAAPNGTAVLAAHAPLNEVELLNGQSVVTEDSFYDKMRSIASANSNGQTVVYGATYSVTTNGSGDIYQRVQLSSSAAQWSIALDTDKSEASVANTGSAGQMLALVGGEGQEGLIYDLGAGGFSQIATLGSAIPLTAVNYKNVTYVGAMQNTTGGGAAKLYRLLGSAVEEINFPASAGGNGIRQEIVGMVSVAGTASASIAAGSSLDLLVIAVGNFDRLTHAGSSGQVLVHDGKDWETLVQYVGEAPTSLAFIDNTLYVGTTGGKLQYRDRDQKWIDEPSLPVNDGVTALLVRDSATLAIGLRGQNGAQYVLRSAKGGVVAQNRYFLPDVSAILVAKCTVCHSGTTMPAAVAVYGISAAANSDADFTTTRSKVDLAAPANSRLLVKAMGGLGHVGGAPVAAGSADEKTILDWVTQGAIKQAAAGPGPGPGPGPTPTAGPKYLTDVKPILMAGQCVTCHGPGSNRAYLLSAGLANDNADFTATRARTNVVTPDQSEMLQRAAVGGVATHPVRPITAAQRQTIIDWINTGRNFQ